MQGSLLQLVAKGAEDITLIGNPQITYFKAVYKRYTNFAIESMQQTTQGDSDFQQIMSFNINRSGDLIGAITLETTVGLNLNNMFDTNDSEVGDYKISSKTEDFNGWLLCDGRSLNKNKYKRLYDKIGYSFGGSGNTFQLPDLRNKIIGFTDTGSVDSNGPSGNVYELINSSSVNIATDILTVVANTDKWLTGMAVTFPTTTGTLPDPLNNSSTYYVIRINSTTIKLATTLANAVLYTATNLTALNITTTGTGMHTMRYTLSTRTLGESSGEEAHGLTITEMPEHNHGVAASDQIASNNLTASDTHDHTGSTGNAGSHIHTASSASAGDHSHTGTTNTTGAHTHIYQDAYFAENTGAGGALYGTSASTDNDNSFYYRTAAGGYSTTPSDLNTGSSGSHSHTLSTNTTGSHTHSITVDSVGNHNHSITAYSHTHTLNSAGGTTAHNNMQPTLFAGSIFIYCGIDKTSNTVCNNVLKEHLIRWGFHLIDYIEILINGQVIDKQYGEWLDIWSQLTYTQEKYDQLVEMVNTSIFTTYENTGYDKIAKLYIPLQFWFNRNPGLALPLIALQYNDVRINVRFNSKDAVNTATSTTSTVVKIENFNYDTGTYTKTNFIEAIISVVPYVDYYYLDGPERRMFAQTAHEYLIEQVQSIRNVMSSSESLTVELTFNHPLKNIVWVGQKNNYTVQLDQSLGTTAYDNKYFLSQLYDYTALPTNDIDPNSIYKLNSDIVKTAQIKINGLQRFVPREGSYFRTVQPNMYISRENSSISKYQNSYRYFGGNIYMYNFCLYSDIHKPSGELNVSRVDNIILSLTMNPYATDIADPKKVYDYTFYIYAVNYNTLRIASGMAGLVFNT